MVVALEERLLLRVPRAPPWRQARAAGAGGAGRRLPEACVRRLLEKLPACRLGCRTPRVGTLESPARVCELRR